MPATASTAAAVERRMARSMPPVFRVALIGHVGVALGGYELV